MDIEVGGCRHNSIRGVLHELDQNIMDAIVTGKGKGIGLKGETWKRVERKNKAICRESEFRQEGIAQGKDSKRLIQQSGEGEGSIGEAEIRKRAKRSEAKVNADSFEVEVAYLEWP